MSIYIYTYTHAHGMPRTIYEKKKRRDKKHEICACNNAKYPQQASDTSVCLSKVRRFIQINDMEATGNMHACMHACIHTCTLHTYPQEQVSIPTFANLFVHVFVNCWPEIGQTSIIIGCSIKNGAYRYPQITFLTKKNIFDGQRKFSKTCYL